MKSSLEWCGLVACFALLSLSAAKAAEDKYPERNAAAPAATAQSIRGTFTVSPGQSIQSAVDRARPGDRIQVLPGTYSESVTIDFDDIELVGVVQNGERPTFEGKNSLNDAVLASGNNFVISGFEIRNYKGNGVVVNKAKNATFKDLVCHNTGKYGVYPVLCQGVLVDGCVVSDVWDAGVYAGQCRDVVIQNCESYRNTIGMETENCVNVLMANNSAHQNSLGLLVVLLPDLPTTAASNARVINNRVLDNNYPNVSPPGNTVNLVEPGIGIAVNAADNTEVTKNEVRGHGSYGIALYALTDVFPPEHKLNVEPNPDNNYIHDNSLAENGAESLEAAEEPRRPGGRLVLERQGGGQWLERDDRQEIPGQTPRLERHSRHRRRRTLAGSDLLHVVAPAGIGSKMQRQTLWFWRRCVALILVALACPGGTCPLPACRPTIGSTRWWKPSESVNGFLASHCSWCATAKS